MARRSQCLFKRFCRAQGHRVIMRLLVFGILGVLLLLGAGQDVAHGDGTRLAIVHQNDLRGRLEPFDDGGQSVGGLARMATVVEEIRGQYPGAALWLDGGDTWHGTVLANLFSGSPVVEAFNAAGLDAMVLGNHEFGFGQEVLARLVAEARFPVLSANTVQGAEGRTVAYSSAVYPVGGLRVAVLGLTTPATATSMHPGYLEGLHFLDPFEVAAELVPRLREEADLVVVLSHLGYGVDLDLAERVPGIDVIVGGHSRTVLPEAVAVGDTLIVQAGEYGRYLGVLELVVEGGQVVAHHSRLIPITDAIAPHPRVQAVIEAWAARVPGQLEAEVGYTEVELGGEGQEARWRETALGNLVADAIRLETGADVAFINGGAVRSSIPAGPIRMRHVQSVLPFGGPLVGLYLTGAELMEVLEHSVSLYPMEWGGFLQVSGLTFTFDPARPVGGRVLEVRAGDMPLEPNRAYRVVVNDFLAAGGDQHTTLAQAPVWFGPQDGGGTGIHEAVAAYLRRAGTVAPRVEGRIRVAGAEGGQ